MKPTFASLCGGGRLADIGALQAGYELLWDVEIDPQIAEVGSQLPGKTIVSSVTEVDYPKLESPDVLWASPPCPSFSVAKTNGKETAEDLAIAHSVVDAVKALQPKTFILENVEGYKNSQSLRFVEGALYALGYWIDRQVLNSADFSVPQTRRRLILRAVRGFIPSLPAKSRWVGWYEAIEDLIPSLPETEFAQWQLDRLPAELLHTSYVDVANTIRDCTVRGIGEPSPTVTAEKLRRPASTPRAFIVESKYSGRNEPIVKSSSYSAPTCTAMDQGLKAFLVDGTGNAYGSTATIVNHDEPSFTVKASSGKQASREWLEQGRVVAMTPRALARFQTVPDEYQLPDKKQLACKIIGNGVPCLLAKSLLEIPA